MSYTSKFKRKNKKRNRDNYDEDYDNDSFGRNAFVFDSDSDTEDGDELIFKHRRKKFIFTVLGIIVIIILGIIYYDRGIKNRVFTEYSVRNTIEYDSKGDLGYMAFCDGAIKYSADGVSYFKNGKEVWNKSINMTTPCIDICGSYIVMAEKNSNSISLFDESGNQMDLTSSYPVVGVEVSKQGVVAATLDDGTANYIEVTSKDGEKIASGRTVLSGDGYPVDVSISEDGEKIVASYLSVSSGAVSSKVVFYNFSSVGQNEVDRIVGGFNQYETTLVPDVEFINNTTVVAVGDNMFSIYTIDEKPKLKYEKEFSENVDSFFYTSDYIGFVFSGTESGERQLVVYNTSGKEILREEFDFAYTDIAFNEKNVIMYNDTIMQMYSFSGKQTMNLEYDKAVTKIIPRKKRSLMVISEGSIEDIYLK